MTMQDPNAVAAMIQGPGGAGPGGFTPPGGPPGAPLAPPPPPPGLSPDSTSTTPPGVSEDEVMAYIKTPHGKMALRAAIDAAIQYSQTLGQDVKPAEILDILASAAMKGPETESDPSMSTPDMSSGGSTPGMSAPSPLSPGQPSGMSGGM